MATYEPPVSWFVELYPDAGVQGRMGPVIGGPEGLQKLYDGLIVKSKEALKGSIDAIIEKQGRCD